MEMNFKIALRETLNHEGGYTNDAYDSGGKTNYGITIGVARQNGYNGDMKDIDMETVERIYKKCYWTPLKLDKLESQKVANKVFDIGVNMGIGTSAKILQKTINILNKNQKKEKNITVDGNIGRKSISALNKLLPHEEKYVLLILSAYQAKKYIEICEKTETQERFIRGWIKRAFKGNT